MATKTQAPAPAAPSVAELLTELEAKGGASLIKTYEKQGATGRILGVKMGDVRAIAKPLKTQHALGLALWASGCFEAQVLAALLLEPKALSEAEVEGLVASACGVPALDKLTDNVLPTSPGAAALRARWTASGEALLARAGWNLTTAAAKQDKQGREDWAAVLARIEAELPQAPRPVKEAMNECLVMIAVYHPEHEAAALAAGERLGRWDDRPVPKGCTASYPPEWIPAAIRLRRPGGAQA